VLEKTKQHLLDTIAAMVSGSRLLPGKMAISYVKALGGNREATVVASKFVTSAVDAALANGMLAHADETDDSHPSSGVHPGCGIVPAALAMAERYKRSGAELLRAVALGYDVSARLAFSLHDREFHVDGHSVQSFSASFGAPAAAGALAGLDHHQTRHLLSYTAQQASGLSCWMRDEHHIEKAFDFGGMPARNGVAAATMVAQGFTAVEDVFAGERNFFVAYGRMPDAAELIRELGSSYEIMKANIKRWPVGYPIQAPLDSLQQLICAHNIKPDKVKQVVVRISHYGANNVNNRSMPDICMQHLCAIMLLDSNVTFNSAHDDARMRQRDVLALRNHIELRGDDALQRALPSHQAIVEIELRDGRKFRHHTKAVRGTRDNPMTRADIDAKGYDLTAAVLGKRRARHLCNALWNIDKLGDVRALRPLLQTY
jgi:2-methylcitrate dehydratase PrpD